jgi:hypothetical protein
MPELMIDFITSLDGYGAPAMSFHSGPTVEATPAESMELPSASIATFHTTTDQL